MNISNTLIKRIVTVIILAPLIILGIIFLSAPTFCFLAAIVLAPALWEWTLFLGLRKTGARIGVFMLMAFLYVGLIYFVYEAQLSRLTVQNYLLAITFLWLVCLIYVASYRSKPYKVLKNPLVMFVLGTMLVFAFWLSVMVIRMQPHGQWWIIYIFLVIWAADIGAYIFGRLFGERKLAPHVSPGKTIAGLSGGIALSVMTALAYGWFLLPHFNKYLSLIAFTILSVLFAVLGDLFISILKRHQGIKDTGVLLPGHGGFLDRIDSSLAALPMFALGTLLFRFTL